MYSLGVSTPNYLTSRQHRLTSIWIFCGILILRLCSSFPPKNHYHPCSNSIARWTVFTSVCLWVCVCVCLYLALQQHRECVMRIHGTCRVHRQGCWHPQPRPLSLRDQSCRSTCTKTTRRSLLHCCTPGLISASSTVGQLAFSLTDLTIRHTVLISQIIS